MVVIFSVIKLQKIYSTNNKSHFTSESNWNATLRGCRTTLLLLCYTLLFQFIFFLFLKLNKYPKTYIHSRILNYIPNKFECIHIYIYFLFFLWIPILIASWKLIVKFRIPNPIPFVFLSKEMDWASGRLNILWELD